MPPRSCIAVLIALLLLAAATARGALRADDFYGVPKLWRPNLAATRETTYFTGPRLSDGRIDYAAAFHEKYSRGIDPKKNAVAAVLAVLGPAALDRSFRTADRDEFYGRLGIAIPPEEGEYYVDLTPYSAVLAEANGGLTPEAIEVQSRLTDQYFDPPTRPWTAKECPELAGWIAYNRKPLDRIASAMELPQAYLPVIGGRDARLADGMMLLETKLSTLGRLFGYRALLRAGQGEWKAALQDLESSRRASRLIAANGYLVNLLIAHAAEQESLQCAAALAASPDLPPEQAKQLRKWLDEFPALPVIEPRFLESERVFSLCELQHFAYSRYRLLKEMFLPHYSAIYPWDDQLYCVAISTAAPCLDWARALRRTNEYYDEYEKLPWQGTRKEYVAALEAFRKKWGERASRVREDRAGFVVALLDSRGLRDYLTEHFLAGFLNDSAVDMRASYDLVATRRDLARVALAIAEFRREKMAYPAKLDELVPNYLPALPLDPFTSRGFFYERQDEGYKLYGVGHNERDDGGDELDVVIRVTR